MTEKAPESHFFTDLDTILDTRMGTLLRLDSDCTNRVLKAGYLTRDRDLFVDIDREQFKELYAKRDKQTLQASMMTPIMEHISNFCKQSYEMNIKTPFTRIPKIVINTYPYQLTQDEIDLIMRAIYARLGKMVAIQPVYMKYDDISPTYLKKNTSIIALYDPYEWLEIHSRNENLKRDTCPFVMMLGPLMFRNLDERDVKILDVRRQLELLCKPFIDIVLLPLITFSADVLPKSKKQNNTRSI